MAEIEADKRSDRETDGERDMRVKSPK